MTLENKLRLLSSQLGLSGYEKETGITNLVKNMLDDIGVPMSVDNFGNAIAVLGEGSETVMFEAHMDEVGFVINNSVADRVFLRTVGNIDIKKINGEKILLPDGTCASIRYDEISNSIYVSNKNNVTYKDGSPTSFCRTFVSKDNVVEAVALDNRSGCAAIMQVLEDLLKEKESNRRFVFVFSVGEETNKVYLGDILRLYKPNLFVVIDSAYALPVDFDYKSQNMVIPSLGDGPALQCCGAGFEVSEYLINSVFQIAKENSIPIQTEQIFGGLGRTNFTYYLDSSFQNGIVINTPVQSQHRQISKLSLKDLENTVKLLKMIANQINILQN